MMTIKEISNKIMDEIEAGIQNVDEDTLRTVFSTIHGGNRIFFHANGRSMLTIKYFAQRLMHQAYRVYIVGDVATPAIRPDDVLVIVSADGEEENLVAAAKKAKEIGDIPVILVTAAEKSTLSELADVVVKLNVPVPGSAEDNSIQPIGAQFEQAVLYVMDVGMSHYFMDRLGITLTPGENPLHANLQ
ncbi:MAG: SIS domain-containing protein [Christensenellaceae bacterium]|jgi:6-phospho-3-hexuloisomerase